MTSSSGFSASRLVSLYRERTPKSQALAERARLHFPSGVNHDGRFVRPYPLAVERSRASRKWDLDGNEYVDYSGGHGSLLLGHNAPEVLAAVTEQLERGTHYGACHELEVEWGGLIRELMPAAQRVRFSSSGTEATTLALRLARAFKRKGKVLRFQGHFHGWQDHTAFGYSSHFDGTPTPGVLPEVAKSIVLAPPNRIEETQRLLETDREIAAVILEPTGATWGQVPIAPEFVVRLREITRDLEVPLIFDEVISGFRCAPGGAQAVLGVEPDLFTLGKIVSGGFPGAAVAGREEILSLLDFDEADRRGREKVPHPGTYNGNPISSAAGAATLRVIRDTDACERANRYAARLRERLEGILIDLDVPWLVYGTYSGFHLLTSGDGDLEEIRRNLESGSLSAESVKRGVDRELIQLFRVGMLAHGVDLMGWPGGPTSAVHSEEDLEWTAEAFRSTVTVLKEEGRVLSSRRARLPGPSR